MTAMANVDIPVLSCAMVLMNYMYHVSGVCRPCGSLMCGEECTATGGCTGSRLHPLTLNCTLLYTASKHTSRQMKARGSLTCAEGCRHFLSRSRGPQCEEYKTSTDNNHNSEAGTGKQEWTVTSLLVVCRNSEFITSTTFRLDTATGQLHQHPPLPLQYILDMQYVPHLNKLLFSSRNPPVIAIGSTGKMEYSTVCTMAARNMAVDPVNMIIFVVDDNQPEGILKMDFKGSEDGRSETIGLGIILTMAVDTKNEMVYVTTKGWIFKVRYNLKGIERVDQNNNIRAVAIDENGGVFYGSGWNVKEIRSGSVRKVLVAPRSNMCALRIGVYNRNVYVSTHKGRIRSWGKGKRDFEPIGKGLPGGCKTWLFCPVP